MYSGRPQRTTSYHMRHRFKDKKTFSPPIKVERLNFAFFGWIKLGHLRLP